MRSRPYVIDTVKHLMSIIMGTALAFRPTVDTKSLPADVIQDDYINDYKIENYIPSIMEPCYFEGDEPVYYSLQHPSLLVYPRAGFRSTMKDLQDIQYLMDILLQLLKTEKHSIHNMVENVQLDYFHSEPNEAGYRVRPTMEIAKEDKRFLQLCGQNKVDNRVFSHSGSFLRGCIRIKSKK